MQYQTLFTLSTNQAPKTASLFLLLVTTLSTINIALANHSHENIGTTSSNSDSSPKILKDKLVDTDISKHNKSQATAAKALQIKTVSLKTISDSAESDNNLVDDTQHTITQIKPTTEIVPKNNTDVKLTGILIRATSGNASYKVKPSE